MFNVCPNCGEYDESKQVLHSPVRAKCGTCEFEHPFRALPLFVVTGASGAGKTTAALQLGQSVQPFVILDQDILWSDAFNKPDEDFNTFRNTWLRMVKNIHQAGKSVILFGSAIPEQYERCTERRYLSEINYMALYCRKEVLTERLKARPQWRQSASDENLVAMLQFNNWLYENAAKTSPKMHLLDTSDIDVEDTGRAIIAWASKLSKKAPLSI